MLRKWREHCLLKSGDTGEIEALMVLGKPARELISLRPSQRDNSGRRSSGQRKKPGVSGLRISGRDSPVHGSN